MFNQIWKIISALSGLAAGFFFVKSKIQEKKIDEQQAEIEVKEQQIEAKESEIAVIKKQYKNEKEMDELKTLIRAASNNVDKETADEIDKIEMKAYDKKDKTEYKVTL